MIPWNNYKTEAKNRGALAMEVFVVETTPTSNMDEVKQRLPEHLAYQAEKEATGQLMFAGPLSDASGEFMNASGMIIYRAQTIEQARELADQDPMHKYGARTYTIKRWLINEGSLQMNVKLSAQSVTLTPE